MECYEKDHIFVKEKQQKYIHSERLQGVNVFELLESSASNILIQIHKLLVTSKNGWIFAVFPLQRYHLDQSYKIMLN